MYKSTCKRIYLGIFTLLLLITSCNEVSQEDYNLEASLPNKIDYNYHIKPILSDRCYACHGPDDKTREADLRLDTPEGALKMKLESGKPAIVAGSTSRSEFWHRITSDDPQVIMPPPESHLTLSDYEVAILGKWIEQGAEWKSHWSFIPPERPDIPRFSKQDFPIHEIDHFILAQLERKGLTPSQRAQKSRLIRRLSLDLRGLPPTLEEIDAFIKDEDPHAYEKLVDMYLSDSAFGERMALDWMDVARYADSHGMHADGWRNMWPWRDWVIQAFNDNMPYDQFIMYQMAGDMLPAATKNQILATAFHRNHQMTAEGGVIDEEFRLEYVFDRTHTTATAFLGLTMECARCHDHKFDPLSQKDFYSLAAFFNNIKEVGMTGDDGNYGPVMLMSTDTLEAKLHALDQRINRLYQQKKLSQEDVTAQKAFLTTLNRSSVQPRSFLLARYPLDKLKKQESASGNTQILLDNNDQSTATGELELVKGKTGNALRFDHDYDVLYLQDIANFEITESFSIGAWIKPEKKGEHQTIIGNSGNKNNFWRGWEMTLDTSNHVWVRLIHSLPHNYIHIVSEQTIPLNTWTHVMFTYDGTAKASGVKLYINGRNVPVQVRFDQLYKSMRTIDSRHNPEDRAIRVAKSYRAFTGDNGIYLGSIDDIRIYDEALTELEVAAIHPDPEVYERLLAEKPESTDQHRAIRYTRKVSDLDQQIQLLLEKRLAMIDTVSEVMVMGEMKQPRPMYVLERGSYTAPQEQVAPATPNAVLPFPENFPPNRVGLAQWLISPENPLTARVTVNRYWQMIFGQGLVRTPQDFGSQGNLPTHPLLLDHLATWFMASGWDIKALMKYMVMSATYQQESTLRPELISIDPNNEFLARGPSFRLPAEHIRDHALAVSGLLVDKIGGPSVKPYQPQGLWIDKGNFSPKLLYYVQDSGANLYRRSLYTFIRRTSPPPSMIAFDATDRSYCSVQRQTTNTPMQALILLNDPQFVEASRVMAERIIREGGNNLNHQLRYGFRLATGRIPHTEELDILNGLYQEEYERFVQAPDSAQALLQTGAYPRDTTLDLTQHAAMTNVASMLLNHDEAYMKR